MMLHKVKGVWHKQTLRDPSGDAYRHYLEMRSQGLYGTNALESQFDLVYAFCQRELALRHPGRAMSFCSTI